ncbi:MAG: peptidase S14 [Sphingobium sp. 66-54]|nr:MAG: peptidase S14 [Sphingobium sp. 66-54]
MTEILIYGIVGDWWDGLDAATLVPAIAAGDDDLDIRINSPGGYVMEGLAIFNAIDREVREGRKVTVYIDGLAASMASVIAMVGTEIVMAENALMMIHNPWDCACGDAEALRSKADQLDKIKGQLVGIYAKRTGIAADTLATMLDNETWLTGAEALEQGFVTSVAEAMTVAASFIKPFGFRNAPEKSPLISPVAMARGLRTAAAAHQPPKETHMPNPANPAANSDPAGKKPNSQTDTSIVALTQADVDKAVAVERDRTTGIRALGKKHGMDETFISELIGSDTTLDCAREKILDKLAETSEQTQIGHSRAAVTVDARDKFIQGASAWLMVKAGVAPIIAKAAKARGEKIDLDPGEFRGVRNADLAREALTNMGVACGSRNPEAIVQAAMTARDPSMADSYARHMAGMGFGAITQTTGDFPILFELVAHRILQAAYAVTPDTWSRFCGTGTVVDFRPHTRYLRGTFGALEKVNEAGEFKNKPISDLAKEAISADTKGNIVTLSRQAIVNDDMGIFSNILVDLGRAAKLTVEVDVYALLTSNPLMNDGKALFHADHNNLASAGAVPSVAAFDAIAVAMAQQKDIDGNEFLDIRPSIGLFPLSLRGAANVVNGSEYDPDAVNKLQKPNIVRNMLSDVVATPRLSGTAYYMFADKDVAPAIEVVFLNGVTEPFTDSQEGWRVDGVEWKVRFDYGVGALNWRSAYKQPGAAG